MTRLLDRLKGQRAIAPAYLQSSDPLWALAQTWSATPNVEKMQPTFDSYASDGFAGNAVVYGVIFARLRLFTQARFKFQAYSDEHIFSTPALAKLENPWPGGTTAELLARMEQDGSLAGNAFVRDAGDRLERLRPDWVQIVSGVREDNSREVIGYLYDREGNGRWQTADFYVVDEVAHWSPIPDPLATWRGMSWLTPVVREINADSSMSAHKQSFFDNAAIPNMIVKYDKSIDSEAAKAMKSRIDATFAGPRNAYKTLVFGDGADITFASNSFTEMAFTAMQAAGENRIATAAGVPPIVAGLKEGLEAATYSNYVQAMRAFGEGTMAFLWQSATDALAKLVNVPSGCRLWYDKTHIDALQESQKDRAEAFQILVLSLGELVRTGFVPDSAISATFAGDVSLLKHTGAIPTALYPEGKAPTPGPKSLPPGA